MSRKKLYNRFIVPVDRAVFKHDVKDINEIKSGKSEFKKNHSGKLRATKIVF